MDDLVAKLRTLHQQATPAPWFTLDPPWLPSGSETSILAESPDPHVARFICDFDLWALDDDNDRKSECPDADADLIVKMRNALPDLLDRIESLEAQLAQARRDALEAIERARQVLMEDNEEGLAKYGHSVFIEADNILVTAIRALGDTQ